MSRDIVQRIIEHEENLINRRLTWMLTFQGFLFASLSLFVNKKEDILPTDVILLLEQLIPYVGICVSIVILLGIVAAYRSITHNKKTSYNEDIVALLLGRFSSCSIPIIIIDGWLYFLRCSWLKILFYDLIILIIIVLLMVCCIRKCDPKTKISKKWILGAFTVGLITGILFIFLCLNNLSNSVSQFYQLKYLADKGKETFQAYKQGSPEVAIWALDNHLQTLQIALNDENNDKEIIESDLMLTHTRLAIVYKSQGNEIAYKENIKKSLLIAKKSDPNETEENLLKIIKKYDKPEK